MLSQLAPISVELRAELQPRQARGLRRAEAAEQRCLDEPCQPVRDAQRLRPCCMGGCGLVAWEAAALVPLHVHKRPQALEAAIM